MPDILIPDFCPSCHTKLVLSSTKVDLVCPNAIYCPAQVLGRLSYFTSRGNANIEGLSEKTLGKFVENQGIHDVADIFDLDFELAREWEGFGQKSIDNLEKSIAKTKTGIIDYKFLAGLGIEGIGPEVARLIVSRISQD